MHTMRISSRCSVLFLFISLCVIRQVSSRKCYVCESKAEESCFNNVNDGDFQYDCAETIKDHSKFIDNNSFEHLLVLIKEYSTGIFVDYQPGNVHEFECVTITGVTGKNLNEEKIVRGCIPKFKNCDDFEAHLAFSGFLRNSCERCDENLCNSLPQVPWLSKTFRNTERYTEATTIELAKSDEKTTTVKTKRLPSLDEKTESDIKVTTAESKRLSSLAEEMKFDYRIGVWWATIVLRLTFF